jgi:hypothetical protein
MVLHAYMCVCAFSLYRESPDMILGDKLLIFEMVLSQPPCLEHPTVVAYLSDLYADTLDRQRHGEATSVSPSLSQTPKWVPHLAMPL